MTPTFTFPQVREPIIHSGNEVPCEVPGPKAIRKPDEAPQESHPVPDEKLTEERQMGPHDLSPFEDEPVGGDEDSQSCDNPDDNALDRRVQAQEAGQDKLLNNFFYLCHGVGLLEIFKQPPQAMEVRTAMEDRHGEEHGSVPEKRTAPSDDEAGDKSIAQSEQAP
jgi:hypothetical protein